MVSKGIVFNIQRFSVNDGPGIRTIVFLKGCPLRCLWCSNPESHNSSIEISYIRKICLLCQRCIQVCPNDALRLEDDNIVMDSSKCDICGKCVKACPVNARKIEGKEYTVEQLFNLVAKDRVFFKTSGGGITISGGEPFVQFDFLMSFIKKCKKESINVAIETCGFTEWNKIKITLEYVDLFLYDIKQMDPKLHKKYTGVDNIRIIDNFKKLMDLNVKTIVRFPFIPGYNDDVKNLNKMIGLLREVNYMDELHILPYHRLGSDKYHHLGKDYQLKKLKPPEDNEVERVKKFFEDRGFVVKLFG